MPKVADYAVDDLNCRASLAEEEELIPGPSGEVAQGEQLAEEKPCEARQPPAKENAERKMNHGHVQHGLLDEATEVSKGYTKQTPPESSATSRYTDDPSWNLESKEPLTEGMQDLKAENTEGFQASGMPKDMDKGGESEFYQISETDLEEEAEVMAGPDLNLYRQAFQASVSERCEEIDDPDELSSDEWSIDEHESVENIAMANEIQSLGSSGDSTSEDDDYSPLRYQIPLATLLEAQKSPRDDQRAYWSYEMYRNADNEGVTLHYCRRKEDSERIAQLFLGKQVLGCDLEWKSQVRASSTKIKEQVSLIQLACEERIALFQIAVHAGDTPEDLLAPTLKAILETSDIVKCGVNIKGDFYRLQKHFGITPASIFELSHLYKLVEFGADEPEKVNKKTVSLKNQVENCLHLPLWKGEERTSDWTAWLNKAQCKYAADDAYASYRVFEVLKDRWSKLDPRPPFPACAELGLPIRLAVRPDNGSGGLEYAIAEGTESDEESLAARLKHLEIATTTEVDEFGDDAFAGLASDQLDQLEKGEPVTFDLEHSSDTPTCSPDQVHYPHVPGNSQDKEKPATAHVGRVRLKPRYRPEGHAFARPLPSRADLLEAASQLGRIGKTMSRVEPPSSSHDVDSCAESSPSSSQDTDSRLERSPSSSQQKDLLVQAAIWAAKQLSSAQPSSSGDSLRKKFPLNPTALRAYYLWEHQKLSLEDIAVIWRDPPVQKATIAAYVAESLQFGDLPWTDSDRLKILVKSLSKMSYARYWRLREISSKGESWKART